MPRYFFHTHFADDVVTDPEGRELADPDAAWNAARVLALQLLQGAQSDPELYRAVLVVADEADEIVFEMPLAEALTAEPVSPPEGGTAH
jgi:hypothetical protein